MFYTVYKTTHLVTGQYYIGRHVTDDLEDRYFGSGSSPMLKDKKNLSKEIVEVFDCSELMVAKEIELIQIHIDDPLCVNMVIGDPTYGGVIKHSQSSKDKISKGVRTYNENNADAVKERHKRTSEVLTGRKFSEEHKKNLSLVRKGVPKSDEFKKNVSKTLKGRLLRPRDTLCKEWKITNIITQEVFIVSDRVKFCEEHNLNYPSFNVGTRNGVIYKKTWLCEKLL